MKKAIPVLTLLAMVLVLAVALWGPEGGQAIAKLDAFAKAHKAYWEIIEAPSNPSLRCVVINAHAGDYLGVGCDGTSHNLPRIVDRAIADYSPWPPPRTTYRVFASGNPKQTAKPPLRKKKP